MNGLFDTLNTRFSSGSTDPAIRPRSRLRFEDCLDSSETWGEEETEQSVESASDPTKSMPARRMSIENDEARSTETIPRPLSRDVDSTNRHKDQRQQQIDQLTSVQITQHTTEPAQVHREHFEHTIEIQQVEKEDARRSQLNYDSQNERVAPRQASSVEAPDKNQIQRETTPVLKDSEPPIYKLHESASLVEANIEPSEALRNERIDEQSNTTRIHIGRIDVRIPAQPVQAVAAPAKRRSVTTRTDKGNSPLTDYLGWKR